MINKRLALESSRRSCLELECVSKWSSVRSVTSRFRIEVSKALRRHERERIAWPDFSRGPLVSGALARSPAVPARRSGQSPRLPAVDADGDRPAWSAGGADQSIPDAYSARLPISFRRMGGPDIAVPGVVLAEMIARREARRSDYRAAGSGSPALLVSPSAAGRLPVTETAGNSPEDRPAAARERAGGAFGLAGEILPRGGSLCLRSHTDVAEADLSDDLTFTELIYRARDGVHAGHDPDARNLTATRES
jgi:hypothetical protein